MSRNVLLLVALSLSLILAGCGAQQPPPPAAAAAEMPKPPPEPAKASEPIKAPAQAAPPVAAAAAVSKTGEAPKAVKARLIADVTALEPGKKARIGVLFQIDPGWHIYWKNPGDMGFATEVKWELPPDLAAGPVIFPAPMGYTMPGDIKAIGYEGEALLVSEVNVGSGLKPGAQVEIKAATRYLMCSETQCVEGKLPLTLTLPVGPGQPANAAAFAEFDRLRPQPADKTVTVDGTIEGGGKKYTANIIVSANNMTIAGEKRDSIRPAAFFPNPVEGFVVSVPAAPSAKASIAAGDKKLAAHKEPIAFQVTLEPEEASNTKKPVVSGLFVGQSIEPDGKPGTLIVREVALPASK